MYSLQLWILLVAKFSVNVVLEQLIINNLSKTSCPNHLHTPYNCGALIITTTLVSTSMLANTLCFYFLKKIKFIIYTINHPNYHILLYVNLFMYLCDNALDINTYDNDDIPKVYGKVFIACILTYILFLDFAAAHCRKFVPKTLLLRCCDHVDIANTSTFLMSTFD
ncbi:hypothetical protein RFI_31609 [Reticulomyxa filosa]|uniref:Uncharacterized protein n=1 Tax=Reticulomyxa filosa TaxID=46433 RepID=X6LWQ4_RETFI|nr:hypothetical protein RFI_31609 [Reticulomyxa filosa]|eukprot:ETO05791.1 hypothetical protein RFI_31609 [Reticulomyxa filosa]